MIKFKKELNIDSEVPYGKYKSTKVSDYLIKDKKEIFNLLKLGYSFSEEILEKVGITKKTNAVQFSCDIAEHEFGNATYEKDSMSLKNILKSLHTIDSSAFEVSISKTVDENNDTNENDE